MTVRRFVVFITLSAALAIVFLAPQTTHATHGSCSVFGNGARFYKDIGWHGDSFEIDRGRVMDAVYSSYNDQISSICIAPNAKVTIYEHANFGGASYTWSNTTGSNLTISDLRNYSAGWMKTWNDRLSSIKVSTAQ